MSRYSEFQGEYHRRAIRADRGPPCCGYAFPEEGRRNGFFGGETAARSFSIVT